MENDKWKLENELGCLLLLSSIFHLPFSIFHFSFFISHLSFG